MKGKNKKGSFGEQKQFASVGEVLERFKTDEGKKGLPPEYSQDKYISREFQKYGYELAKELGDLKNKSLYIKLAKETPRGLLEATRSFVKDAYGVKSPTKLYMWKLSQLKSKKADKNKGVENSKFKTSSKKLKK